MSPSSLVLVHGFTQTGASWAPLLPALIEAGSAPVTPDVPQADDLWGAARDLARACGRGSWVGYSMGGRIALHVALQSPALVERLVLVSATAGIDDRVDRATRRERDEGLARWVERAGVDAFLDRWFAEPLFAGLSAEAADRQARLRNSPATLENHLRQLGTGSQEPLWHRLGEFRMPVLVVVGERDRAFEALGRRLVAGIGPAASLAVVAGAGHAVPFEQPGGFLDAVLPFLVGDDAGRHSTRPIASSTP